MEKRGSSFSIPHIARPKLEGLVLALAYRLLTVLIAPVGLCYYLGGRREVSEAMHEEKASETASLTEIGESENLTAVG